MSTFARWITGTREPRSDAEARDAGVRAAVPAFESVYRECFPMVWRGLRRLGVPEAHTDDAAQEVFLRVHCHLATFEGRASIRSWVYGIAVNVAREHRRRARTVARYEAPAGTDEGAELHAPTAAHRTASQRLPDDVVAAREALRLLDAALDALDDDRRAVLVLADWEELTAPEISAALGVNVNTVYTRLRQARADFESALRRHTRRSP